MKISSPQLAPSVPRPFLPLFFPGVLKQVAAATKGPWVKVEEGEAAVAVAQLRKKLREEPPEQGDGEHPREDVAPDPQVCCLTTLVSVGPHCT